MVNLEPPILTRVYEYVVHCRSCVAAEVTDLETDELNALEQRVVNPPLLNRIVPRSSRFPRKP